MVSMIIRLAIICGYIEIPTIFPPKNAGRKRKTDASKTPQPIEAKQPDFESYESMTKEELIQALIQARITEARLKKVTEVEGGWCGNSLQQQEYQVILELSGEFPVNLLCDAMGINRSSFYYWKKMLSNPSSRTRALIENIQLFRGIPFKISIPWI
ncbi:MAG: hypothetical protein ACLUTU_16380 [Blautia faecis]